MKTDKQKIRNVFKERFIDNIIMGGEMVKVLGCGLEVSEFELQSRYYVHFRTNTHRKSIEPPYAHARYGLNILFFYEDGLGIQKPNKVDMPLNKENKPML